MIPKIIHHQAPADISKWHPIWKYCYESWKINFPEPEYKHIMWTDEYLDDLVATHYKQYLNLYNSFPVKIIKIDFTRFCIMDCIGGIYADMDMYCYANFYNLLNNEIHIVQGAEGTTEKLQNSLMCSIPKHRFWQKCFNHTLSYANKIEGNEIHHHLIMEFCSPLAISKIDEPVSILPNNIFNPSMPIAFNKVTKGQTLAALNIFKNTIKDSHNIITQHFLTGQWY